METLDSLKLQISKSWKNLHHNASLIRHYPEFRNEFEGRLFQAYIVEANNTVLLPMLSKTCSEQFGFDLSFSNYGRGGATIAPDDWTVRRGEGVLAGFAWDVIDDADEEDQVRIATRVLACIQSINEDVRKAVKTVPDWWSSTKKANNLARQINRMDNKRAVMREVWI